MAKPKPSSSARCATLTRAAGPCSSEERLIPTSNARGIAAIKVILTATPSALLLPGRQAFRERLGFGSGAPPAFAARSRALGRHPRRLRRAHGRLAARSARGPARLTRCPPLLAAVGHGLALRHP